jgi:hypothetical protein
MAVDGWYRYISDAERQNIEDTLAVAFVSGVTWYALQRLDDWRAVRLLLALDDPPRECRVGPFYVDELPSFDAVPQRTVQPQKLRNGSWVFGGGTEAATTKPHYVFGFGVIK